MKKAIVISIGFLAFLLLLGASAGQLNKMIIIVKDTGHAKTISLQLANLDNEFTKVFIEGADGRVWYNDYIWNKRGYSANIDLTALKAGDYVLGIKNKKDVAAVALFVTDKQIVHVNTNRSGFELRRDAYFLPTPFSRLQAHFYTERDQPVLGVQLANLLEGATTVQLSKMEGGILFSEHFSGENGYHKTFRLDDADNGLFYLYIDAQEAKVLQTVYLRDGRLQLGPTMGKERALLRRREGVAAR